MATRAKAKSKGKAAAVQVPPEMEMWLGRQQICAILGVGLRTFARMVAEEKFPQPDDRFGHLLKWRASTVNRWSNERGGRADGLGR